MNIFIVVLVAVLCRLRDQTLSLQLALPAHQPVSNENQNIMIICWPAPIEN